MSTATVNGVDLAYVEQGQGEPVLFVHGGVGDYRVWDQQMNAFGAGYRAIALSCRGYWPNPKLRPDESITLDTFVDDLAQFVHALDAGPVHRGAEVRRSQRLRAPREEAAEARLTRSRS